MNDPWRDAQVWVRRARRPPQAVCIWLCACLWLPGAAPATAMEAAAGLATPHAGTGSEAGSAGSGTRAAVPQRSTADHSRFKALQGPFAGGTEVTKVCLSCHTEAARQLMSTRHWTWEYTNEQTGQKLGKKTMLNAFCIGDRSNEAFCQSCHVGYGWKDASFDFKAESKVDCLVCHHQGGYVKPAGMAGEVPVQRTELPPGSGRFVESVDLAKVAQRVGKTRPESCGACHYYGGGDGVKHGDLDSSLNHATRDLDVHMAPKSAGGAGFTCSSCHESDGHSIAGSRIAMTAADPHAPMLRGASHAGRNVAACQSCHGDKPHKQSALQVQLLNKHTDKLACQSCHIPEFARGGVPTKMAWDWSQAGQLTAEGQPFQKKDAHGHAVYDSRKGAFVLGENVRPQYLWFDGRVTYTTQEMTIDPTTTVAINTFHGSPDDPRARIWPVKHFDGKQPYDVVHRQLLVPHTATPDDTAYWYNFDWTKALTAGAAATGMRYSGQYGFVRTQMLWPITHMVAPKERAASCESCHQPAADSRLGDLPGVYLPARDSHPWIDRLGWVATLGALVGVLVHAAIRILAHRSRPPGVRHG